MNQDRHLALTVERQVRARVFISCGQRARTDEVELAAIVASQLEKAGFIPYVAIDHQSLRSIRENIFPQLTDTEYFLFLDFRRDALGDREPIEYRGSLFSHQELAIASYLDKEVLAFQEIGVRPLDGLIGHLQANCIPFTDRTTLPRRIIEEIHVRRWRNDWQNKLSLSLAEPAFDDARRYPEDVMGRFFHLRVDNHHHTRTAQDCVGYIRAVIDSETRQPVPFETVELKWAGYILPQATIAPRSSRRLDAFWLPHEYPTNPKFNCFADSTRFIPYFVGTGVWELTFEVLSASMSSARACLRVELKNQLDDVVVSEISVV